MGTETNAQAVKPDAVDAALGRRSATVAAFGWMLLGGSVAVAIVSPDLRELSACVGLMAFFVAYGFSTRAVYFAARVPQASTWVLFLEGMRRRVTDEPRVGAPHPTT